MSLRWVSVQNRYLIILVEQKEKSVAKEAAEMQGFACLHPQLPAPHRAVHPIMIIYGMEIIDRCVRNEKLYIT